MNKDKIINFMIGLVIFGAVGYWLYSMHFSKSEIDILNEIIQEKNISIGVKNE